jgi:hypothetical protein
MDTLAADVAALAAEAAASDAEVAALVAENAALAACVAAESSSACVSLRSVSVAVWRPFTSSAKAFASDTNVGRDPRNASAREENTAWESARDGGVGSEDILVI